MTTPATPVGADGWEAVFAALEAASEGQEPPYAGEPHGRHGRARPARTARLACLQAAREPGGIDELGLDWSTRGPLLDSRLVTVDAVERRLRERSLGRVNRIGPKRLRLIATAVRAYREADERLP